MSDDKKPREFWLLDDDEVGGYFFYEKQIECDWHVIEHSAYAALAKENVGYAELNKIQKIYLTAAEKEITSLRESLKVAIECLEIYKNQGHFKPYDGTESIDDYGQFAYSTLFALATIKAKGEL